MRLFLSATLLFLLTIPVSGQQTEKFLAYFDYNSHELKPASQATLNDILAKIKSTDVLQIALYGHTDHDGSEDYNKKLSQDRVAAVRAYLVSHGVPNDKINNHSYGEQQPAASNEDEAGKQKNRRVEIVIQYKADAGPAMSKVSKPADNNSGKQTFLVSPTAEMVVKGKMGTVIKIPANAFVDNKGEPVTNDIGIELIEVYTKADMVLHYIQTMSGERLLESAGMVHIKARSQNMEVALKEGSRYMIEFPTKNEKPGMGIFYGDTIAGNIDWQATATVKQLESERETLRGDRDPSIEDEVEKYVFSSTKLGWINCDRFLDKVETFDLVVNTPDMPGASYCMVFKSINSVMNAWYEKGGVKFPNVPVGAQATVVGFKKTDTAIYYSSQAVTLRRREPVTLSLQKMTEAEFNKRVKELN